MQRRSAEGINADVWAEVCKRKRPNHIVEKVKAHSEAAVLTGDISIESYLQNALADAAAGHMAEALVNHEQAKAVQEIEGRAYLIAMRLASIEEEAKEAYKDFLVGSNEPKP